MRRLVFLVILSALMLGCGGCDGAPGALDMSAGPGPCGTAGRDEPLVVGLEHDTSQGQEQVALIKQWARGCGVNVTVKQLPDDTDLTRATYAAAAQGRSPLKFDVILVDAIFVPELARLGYLRPLSVPAAHLRVFPPVAVDAGRYDERLYALPFSLNGALLYYRSDVIGGVPSITSSTPWRDIRQVCAARGHLGANGCLVTQLADYEGRTVNALEAAWSTGPSGALFHPYTDVGAAHPLAAAAGLSELVNGTVGDDAVIAPASLSAKERESIEAFGARKPRAIFMRNWPYAYDVLINEFGLRYGPDFGVMSLPWPSVLGGDSMAVTATSRFPDAAGALVRAMTGTDGWRIRDDTGREMFPPRELFRVGGLPTARTDVYRYGDRPYAQLVADSLKTARPRPVTPEYPAVSAAIRTTVGEWFGQRDAVDPAELGARIRDAAGRH